MKLGYGGTKTEMERLLADAQKLTGVEYNIDNLGDVYDAIHAIQGSLGLTGVAADEAKSTIEGSLGSMSAEIQNVLANLALGEDITPSLQSLMETVSTFFLDNLLPMVTNIITALPQTIVTAVTTIAPNIIPAGVELITSLLDGLAIALPELIQAFVDLIPTFVQQIVNGLPLIIESGMNLLMSLIEGIIEAIPQLIEMLPQLIETFVQVITDNLPLIIEMGIELTIKLIEGLIQAIPQLVKSAPQLIAALAKGLWEGIKTMGQIGLQLVQGLWQGISDATQWVLEKIRGFGESILEGIKGIFGIHSPSKETAWMGDMLMQGLANGIDNNAKKAVNSMRNAADSALGAVDTDAFGFGGGNYTFSGTSGNAGSSNIVLNVYGAQGQDVHQLANIIMDEIQAATDRRLAV